LIIVAEHTAEADMAETDAIVCGVADRSCYPDGHQGLGSGEAGQRRASLCVITRLDSRAISNKKVEIANFQDCSPLNKKVPPF
jgi:hypothetical protein